MTQSEENALFDKFLADNLGKQVIVLPSSQAQGYNECFDEAVAFTNLLGVPHYQGNPSPFPYNNAHEIYDNFGPFQATYFDRIANTATFVPQKGDICIFAGGINGGFGHVSLATGVGDTNTFQSIDTNWSPRQPVTKITHKYNYFLGVLRFKVTNSGTTPQPPMNDEDKARLQAKVDTDKFLTYLKGVGRIVHDDSKLWLLDANDPEKYLGLLKAIWSEREDYRKQAEAVPDTAAATEAGRKAGVKQVQDVVSKLS